MHQIKLLIVKRLFENILINSQSKSMKPIASTALKASLAVIVFLFSLKTYSQDYIKVKLKPEVAIAMNKQGNRIKQFSKKGYVKTNFGNLDRITNKYRGVEMKRVFRYAGKFEEKHQEYGLHLWYNLRLDNPTNKDLQNCLVELNGIEEVYFAEPVYEKSLYGITGENPSPSYSPNDPMYDQQWHYNNTGQTGGRIGADIRLEEAWEIQKGQDNTIVAITDGGIDITHPDLADALWINSIEAAGVAGVDDDFNGYVDDIYGYGFADNTGNILPDPNGHGTHVAGTVGATNNNGVGVSGIAGGSGIGDGVRLMSCAVFGASVQAGGFEEAYVYAADMGAVINQNSWGYTSSGYYEQSVLDAIDYFIDNAGMNGSGSQTGPLDGGLVIFAAGNDGSSSAHYPAYYEPVLAVASTNHMDEKSYYSNYGAWVDIAAPGGETSVTSQGVLSTLPGPTYGFYQGTSMACPHVSGVAALLVSEYGGMGTTPQLIWDLLVENTDSIDSINPGYASQLGSGRLNAYKAIMKPDTIPPGVISGLSVVDSSEITVKLRWTASGASDYEGRANYYEIRYATFQITADNFENATLYSQNILPSVAGDLDSVIITGLNSSTNYYFAIKALDAYGNISEISNVVSSTTLDAPVLLMSPSTISGILDNYNSFTETITISNTGLVDLEFAFDTTVKSSDNFTHSYSQISDTLAPGQSVNIDVTVTDNGTQPNNYTEYITVISNDPLHPVDNITAFVHINGVPDIGNYPSDLSFGNLFLTDTVFQSLIIQNIGTDTLDIDSIVSNNVFFVREFEPVKLYNGDSMLVNVAFAPLADVYYEDSIAVYNNSTANPVQYINVDGTGLLPPVISVTPDSFDVYLFTGDSLVRNLTIDNTSGGNDLTYNISFTADTVLYLSNSKINKLANLGLKFNKIEGNNIHYSYSEEVKADNTTLNFEGQRTSSLSNDLLDMNVAIPYGTRDIFAAELELMGANTSYYSYFDPSILDTVDVLIVEDKIIDITQVSSINDWIRRGGNLIIDADQDNIVFDSLCSGSGISYSATVSNAGYASYISDHPINNDIEQYMVGSSSLCTWEISGNAEVLLQDIYGYNYAVVSKKGNGKIVAIGNESLYGGYDNNLEFGLNAVRWFHSNSGWLSIDSLSGVVPAGGSLDLEVSFNAKELFGGQYQQLININSNDPVNDLITVPATLNVTGIPIISSDTSLIDFDTAFVGFSQTRSLNILNEGTDTLYIDSVKTSNDVYTIVDDLPSLLLPTRSAQITLSFTPGTEGEINEELIIYNNSADKNYTVSLSGIAILPPSIAVVPDSFDIHLFTGDSLTRTLSIDNSGGSNLNYSISYTELDPMLTLSNEKKKKLEKLGIQFDKIDGNLVQYSFSEDVEADNITQHFEGSRTSALGDDLSGMHVVLPLASRSVFAAELELLGASTYYYSYFDPSVLSFSNVLVVEDGFVSASYTGIINDWIKQGGNLIIDADEDYVVYDSLCAGSGITWSSIGCVAGNASFISSHQITDEFDQYYIGSSALCSWDVSDNAEVLIRDNYDRTFVAAADLGSGKIVTIGNESLSSSFDNAIELGVNAVKWFNSGVNWLRIDSLTGSIPAGNSHSLEVSFNATGMYGGNYYKNIRIESNDSANKTVDIPVHLEVTGMPIIDTDLSSINFDSAFVGYTQTRSIVIKNEGTDSLIIDSIRTTNDDFVVQGTIPDLLLPTDTIQINVLFAPTNVGEYSEEIVLYNNSANNNYAIPLIGKAILAPSLTVAPDSFDIHLFNGDSLTRSLNIDNTAGGSDLIYSLGLTGVTMEHTSEPFKSNEILTEKEQYNPSTATRPNDTYSYLVKPGSLPELSKSNDLEDILDSLNVNYTSITDLIPNFYTFSGGETGISISDGGYDMYDGGNFINTNLERSINYSNNIIQNHTGFGSNGQYFTLKVPGLFILGADVDQVSTFEISGNLGADGSGFAESAEIEITVNGQNYLGFIKRVYNSNDPSVNHLIIIPNTGDSIAHTIATNTNDDFHEINGINNTDRIYYLLFAGSNSDLYSNEVYASVMTRFLEIAGSSGWLRIDDFLSGTVPAGENLDIPVDFNAINLLGGHYYQNIRIESNDSSNNIVDIPVHMEVTGTPIINSNTLTLDYDTAFVGYSQTQSLTISNEGTDSLFIDSVKTSNNAFIVQGSVPGLLLPADTAQVTVLFDPDTVGSYSEEIVFYNNSTIGNYTISLNSIAVFPPSIAVVPDSFDVHLYSGDTLTRLLTIDNSSGASTLKYNISLADSDTLTLSKQKKEKLEYLGIQFDKIEEGVVQYSFKEEIEIDNEIVQIEGSRTSNLSDDLSGLNVVLCAGRSAFMTELELLGANTYYYSSFIPSLLDSADVLIIDDGDVSSTYTSLINDWIEQGGSLIIDADGDGSIYDAICSGSGISYSSTSSYSGYASFISSHPVTNEFAQYYISSGSTCSWQVSGNAEVLISDSYGYTFVAAATLGSGKIVAIANESLSSSSENNIELGINAVRWFKSGLGWLSINNMAGSVLAASSVDLEVMFNANGLIGGHYLQNIRIESNDSANSVLDIPVHMEVTGIPVIGSSLSTVEFDSAFVGYSQAGSVYIMNEGTDSLFIDSVKTSNEAFIVLGNVPELLLPTDTAQINIMFAPGVVGSFSEDLIIYNNSAQNEYSISLNGIAAISPSIAVIPDSFDVNLISGDSLIRYLTIDNTAGGSKLKFNISITNKTTTTLSNSKKQKLEKLGIQFNKIEDGIVQYSFAETVSTDNIVQHIEGVRISNLSNDLSGVNVAMLASSRSAFVTELELLGANTYYYSYFEPTILDSTNVLVVEDGNISSLYASVINDWINQGGNLIIDADGDGTVYDAICTGSGITYSSLSCNSGYASHISSHPVTSEFAQYYVSSGSTCSWQVGGNAEVLISNSSGYTFAAAATLGSGKIVAIANESLNSYSENNIELGINAVRWFKSGLDWLSADLLSGVVPAGSSVDVDILFNSTDLYGGDYYKNIRVESNDSANTVVNIPVHLNIEAYPKISTNTSVMFSDVFVNYQETFELEIINVGMDTLKISDIGCINSEITVNSSSMSILPGRSENVIVSFNPTSVYSNTDTLSISYNSFDGQPHKIPVTVSSVEPPVISVNPVALSVVLPVDSEHSETLSISNTGNSVLNYNIHINGSTSDSLENVLDAMNNKFENITSLMPQRFNFTDGISGNQIVDGGDNMYDYGNYLSTSLGSLYYSDKAIQSSYSLGSAGRYFTAKYPGLFMMAADLDSIDGFRIEGSLGSYAGIVDTVTLDLNIGENRYLGYVKRVFDDVTPSVNHLIIVENPGESTNHEFYNYSYSDYHAVWGLENTTRIYYLLWAGNNGYYYNDSIVSDIMSEFLNTANSSNWLQLSSYSGTIMPGSDSTLSANFYPHNMDYGSYATTLEIVSNDPVNQNISVPVDLEVIENQAPYIGNPFADTNMYLSDEALNLDLSNVFVDPEGNPLSYQYSLIDNSIAEISVLEGNILKLTPLAEGMILIEVSATDEHNNTISDKFILTVIRNTKPEIVKEMNNRTVALIDASLEIDLNEIFFDADGDHLNYKATSTDDGIASVSIDNDILTVNYLAIGNTTITVEASDKSLAFVSGAFILSIIDNAAPEIVNEQSDTIVNLNDLFMTLNLIDIFNDPDDDELNYSVSNSNKSVVSTDLSGDKLYIQYHKEGLAIISIEASDNIATQKVVNSFGVMVRFISSTVDNSIEHINVFPNPSSGDVFVDLGNLKGSQLTMEVYTASGELIKHTDAVAGINTLHLSGLEQGVYLLRIGADEVQFMKKIIIVK